MQQLHEVFLRDGWHVDDQKAGGQRLIQVPGPRVAVVHGGDKAGGVRQRNAVVTRHVNAAAEVQRGVEHGQRLVFRHIDLIQNAESSLQRAAGDGPMAQGDLASGEGIRPDQRGRVGVDIERHVPLGTAKQSGEVFRQIVLAGGLGAHQQQMLPAQKGRDRLLPHVPPIVGIAGPGNAVGYVIPHRGLLHPPIFRRVQQTFIHSFRPQKFDQLAHIILRSAVGGRPPVPRSFHCLRYTRVFRICQTFHQYSRLF
ncbi:hypothetical protein SDC9_149940 [bioreactor metagenome]|uniref:Uncharacterized protein n=1 Tax=bioreactor metagenome TaxID=1076179 RepID=A0A645EQ47_9ZZZZ